MANTGTTERQSVKIFKIVEIVIIALATFLYIIGFVSNGLAIKRSNYSGEKRNDGLWYSTICDEHGDCKTSSFKQLLDRGSITDLEYGVIVKDQVFLTIGLCCVFVANILCLMGHCKQIKSQEMRVGMIACSLVAAVILTEKCGTEGKRQSILNESDGWDWKYIAIPWSLVCIGVSAFLMAGIALINVIQELRKDDLATSEEQDNSKVPIVGFVITVFAVILQIIGFSTKALLIYETDTDEWIRYGIWHVEICSTLRCVSITYPSSDGYNFVTGVTSLPVVVLQGIMTVGLIFAIVSGILHILPVCSCIDRLRIRTPIPIISRGRAKLLIMICAFVSGTYVVQLCSFFVVFHISTTSDFSRFQFPWGLLIYILGGILMLVTAFIYLVVLICNHKTNVGRPATGDIQMSDFAPSENARCYIQPTEHQFPVTYLTKPTYGSNATKSHVTQIPMTVYASSLNARCEPKRVVYILSKSNPYY